jgi:glycosyltransferase involved in cell wall biosynthesis
MTDIYVSVITPTFRRVPLVVEAVQSALAQEGVSVESIVLDDSPEGSACEAITSLGDERVHYVKRAVPSQGRPAVVRNEGVSLACGRYLHFLDDDDRLVAGSLHDLVRALDARPDVGVAFGQVAPFGDHLAELSDKSRYFGRAARQAASTKSSLRVVAQILFRGTLMVNSACMIRRSLFAATGGYDASIPVYEDVDFYMRSIRRFGHVFVDRPVLHYRTGAPSLMFNLNGDNTKVVESYQIIHRNYREAHGTLEFMALKGLAKLFPL